MIEIAGSLRPGTTNTPLDERTVVTGIADVAEIRNPFEGMTIYIRNEKRTIKVKSLKSKMIGPIEVADAAIDEYEDVPDAALSNRVGVLEAVAVDQEEFNADVTDHLEELQEKKGNVKTINGVAPDASGAVTLPVGEATIKPATLTIPVPSDRDKDVLSLIVEICEDGSFDEEETTSILMPEWRHKMKGFSNGITVEIPENGVGPDFYGETIVFTFDNEMFPEYIPGKTYFGRFRWIDTKNGRTDWFGFKFTYDVAVLKPDTPADFTTVAAEKEVVGTLEIDYRDGEIQSFKLTGDAIIDREKIRNVPFGKALALLVYPNGFILTIKSGERMEQKIENCLVGAVDTGTLLLTISDIIN